MELVLSSAGLAKNIFLRKIGIQQFALPVAKANKIPLTNVTLIAEIKMYHMKNFIKTLMITGETDLEFYTKK